MGRVEKDFILSIKEQTRQTETKCPTKPRKRGTGELLCRKIGYFSGFYQPPLKAKGEYSKKIKAAFRSRGMAGKHTSSYCPYGYLKSPEDKNQWLVDPVAAAVVKRVFQLTMDGKGPYQICCILKNDRVEIPGYYLAQKGAGLHQGHVFPDPYNWSSGTVCGMLKKKEYLGHTVNFKSAKNSYKDKKNHYVPESEWVIFENTHEPIVDRCQGFLR